MNILTFVHRTRFAVAGALLARAVLKRVTARKAARLQKVEEDAVEVSRGGEELDVDPEEVLGDHTEQGYRDMALAIDAEPAQDRAVYRRRRKDRFVAALVHVARAEFGTPFSPAFGDPKVREAHEIKVATFLRRYCKDRFVRTKDIAMYVPQAVLMYFVPTRADVQAQLVAGSAEISARREEMKRASRPICGAVERQFLRLLGHKVGAVAADPASRAGAY
jgi:hypothetical protein